MAEKEYVAKGGEKFRAKYPSDGFRGNHWRTGDDFIAAPGEKICHHFELIGGKPEPVKPEPKETKETK